MPNYLHGEQAVSENLVFQILLISKSFLTNKHISKMHAIVENIVSSFMGTGAQRTANKLIVIKNKLLLVTGEILKFYTY